MKELKAIAVTALSLGWIATAVVSCGRKDQTNPDVSQISRSETIHTLETNLGPVVKVRVALLNERRAFDASPKTKRFDEELRTYGRSLEEKLKKLMDNQGSSPEDKDLQIEEFKRSAQQEMESKKVKMRAEILAEISQAAATVARKNGYSLVFESNSLKEGARKALFVSDESALADSGTQVQALRSEYASLPDLTDEVCKSLTEGNP